MASAPITAMQEALKTLLDARLPTELERESAPAGTAAYVYSGWPDYEYDLRYPTVSITVPGSGETLFHSPQLLSHTPDDIDPTTEALWKIGITTVTIQIDVWANSVAQRDLVAAAVRHSLRANVAQGDTVLRVQLAAYFNAWASFVTTSSGHHPDSDVSGDEYRWRMDVDADVAELIRATQTRIKTMRVDWSVCDTVDVLTPEPQTIFP